MVIEAEKSHDTLSASRRTREAGVHRSLSESLRIGGAAGVNPRVKV